VYGEFSKAGLEILPHLLVVVHCTKSLIVVSLYLVYILICSPLLLLNLL
jgi:hypothetical protein